LAKGPVWVINGGPSIFGKPMGGIAREHYLKIVKTVDINRRLRELESKSAIQK
jgi:hypothetical protein